MLFRSGLTLPDDLRCTVLIRDVLGKTMAIMADGELAAGNHKFSYASDDAPAGIYFVEVYAGDQLLTKKFLLQR